MKQDSDILQMPQLKAASFKTPEGYFEELPLRMAGIVLGKDDETASRVRIWHPVAIMVSTVAASLLVLLAAGAFLLSRPEQNVNRENSVSLTASAAEISGDDIVEYLIWSGANLEEFADLLDE